MSWLRREASPRPGLIGALRDCSGTPSHRRWVRGAMDLLCPQPSMRAPADPWDRSVGPSSAPIQDRLQANLHDPRILDPSLDAVRVWCIVPPETAERQTRVRAAGGRGERTGGRTRQSDRPGIAYLCLPQVRSLDPGPRKLSVTAIQLHAPIPGQAGTGWWTRPRGRRASPVSGFCPIDASRGRAGA